MNNEIRNRKIPEKSNSTKNVLLSTTNLNESDEFQCKNERVERLQNEEPSKEKCVDNITEDCDRKDKLVTPRLHSVLNSVFECFKTDDCFRVTFEFDFITVILFCVAFWTRICNLSQPNNVV